MNAHSLLTDKQRAELNRAVLAYIATSTNGNNTELISQLQQGMGIMEEDVSTDADEVRKQAHILEKKWTSVVRLQRKVLDMEAQISGLKTELENSSAAQGISSVAKKDAASWLPRAPAKYSLTGHRQPITAVAFHRVFNVLASSSEDGSIKIWDWELGELERTIKGHTKSVVDIDFSENGVLASCSSDLTIKLWDGEKDYSNVRTLTGHDHTISGVRFVPGGTHLVSCSRDKTIRVWDVKSGYAVRTITGHSDWVKSISPSVDGAYVLSAGIDQSARVCHLGNGESKLTFVGHEHVIESAVFAPITAHKHLAQIEGLREPVESQFSSSFEYVATASRDKTIKLWNSRQECIKTLVGHDNWVRQLVFHPEGKYLLSVSDDKTIRCWDLSQNARCVKTITDAHQHFVSCVQWAPPTRFSDKTPQTRCVLATGSVDLDVKIWA